MFTKYFFAHDLLNYARMIPLYLAEMEKLPDSDPEIYQEFLDGNWVVNKNQDVAFCALSADHALEQINRSIKVSGGLVGITLNPNTRTKFFLIAPELARLAEEAKEMAGTSTANQSTHHHSLWPQGFLTKRRTLKSFQTPWKVSQIPSNKRVTSSLTLLQRL